MARTFELDDAASDGAWPGPGSGGSDAAAVAGGLAQAATRLERADPVHGRDPVTMAGHLMAAAAELMTAAAHLMSATPTQSAAPPSVPVSARAATAVAPVGRAAASDGRSSAAGAGSRPRHPGPVAPGVPVVVDRAAWLALATASLAFVVGTINVTVTNVGYPSIVKTFAGASPSLTGWILTGYALSFASTMLAAGRLADRYGRLRVFRLGLGGLVVSSLAAGLAPSVLLLVVARIIQGVCGALAVPASLGLVLPRFPPAKQATVVGIWASVGMMASGLAPLLAAAAIRLASWRWMYLVLVPIALLGLLGAQLFMEETAKADRSRPLDVLGVLMGSGSVFLVVYATLRGPRIGWSAPVVVGTFAAAAVLLPAFLFRSSRHPEPLFDPRLFRIRTFAVANGAVTLAMVGAFTAWVLWPIFLTNVWHYGVWQVALAFTVSPIVSGITAILGGRWVDRHGYRGLLMVAATLGTVAELWALLFLRSEPRFWFSFFPITVLFGLGMGPQASLLNAAALQDIAGPTIATANGVHQSLRYAIGGVGTAVALAVLNGHHDIWRYNTMWIILGAAQLLVIPLLLAYPRRRTRTA